MGSKVAAISMHLSQRSFPHSSSSPSSQTLPSSVSSSSSRRQSSLFCRYADRSTLFFDSRSRSLDNRRFQKRVIFSGMADLEFSKQIKELTKETCLRMDYGNAGILKHFDPLEPSSIQFRANSFDIPLSLRLIKQKKQWEKGFMETGESAYCSVKNAFSSLVFIIQELHSYSIQLKEALFYEDLQGVLEIVFSHNVAIAASSSRIVYAFNTEEVSLDANNPKSDSSIVKTLKSSSSNGKTASVGGNYKPIASETEDDGRRFDESNYHSYGQEEASQMKDESLDQETMQVPNIEAEHLKTDMLYRIEWAREPRNPLPLANYAQFLYLVARDFDRAEEYFKKAIKVEPVDAEALNKYAHFLWRARNDICAADETFQEAISAEPGNCSYLASYAFFLFKTGAEDICFPLDSV